MCPENSRHHALSQEFQGPHLSKEQWFEAPLWHRVAQKRSFRAPRAFSPALRYIFGCHQPGALGELSVHKG
jgi:hypothetical protein